MSRVAYGTFESSVDAGPVAVLERLTEHTVHFETALHGVSLDFERRETLPATDVPEWTCSCTRSHGETVVYRPEVDENGVPLRDAAGAVRLRTIAMFEDYTGVIFKTPTHATPSAVGLPPTPCGRVFRRRRPTRGPAPTVCDECTEAYNRDYHVQMRGFVDPPEVIARSATLPETALGKDEPMPEFEGTRGESRPTLGAGVLLESEKKLLRAIRRRRA